MDTSRPTVTLVQPRDDPSPEALSGGINAGDDAGPLAADNVETARHGDSSEAHVYAIADTITHASQQKSSTTAPAGATVIQRQSTGDEHPPSNEDTKSKGTLHARLRKVLSSCLYWVESFLVDTWWPEMLGLAFSACCLIVVAILLWQYDGNELPHIDSGLTLNVIISILATGSKSSLIFSVAATMSQARWCWYRAAGESRGLRRLQDMQTLDDASRGPLGSTMILFGHTIVSLCSIGAVVVVLALAYDPFVQQLVGYPSRLSRVSTDASTSQAFAINLGHDVGTVTGAVYTGLYGSANSFARTPYCPTGNCTWTPFLSVSWCGTCGSVPERSRVESCDWTLGDLLQTGRNVTYSCSLLWSTYRSLVVTANVQFSSGVETPGDSEMSLELSYPPVWSLNVDTSNYGFEVDVEDITVLGEKLPLLGIGHARSRFIGNDISDLPSSTKLSDLFDLDACYLTPCTKQYGISILNGAVVETAIGIDHGHVAAATAPATSTGTALGLDSDDSGWTCWRPGNLSQETITYENAFDPVLYINTTNMAWCTQDYFPNSYVEALLAPFSGTIAITAVIFRNKAALTSPIQTIDSVSFDYNQSTVFEDFLSDAGPGLGAVFPGIVDSLTYANLRENNTLWPNTITRPAMGTVQAEIPYVLVRWAWIALPVSLNVIGVVFLLITAIYTQRLDIPLWKSSAMALVYHGLGEALIERGRSYEMASDMAEAARGVYVRLDIGEGEAGRARLAG